jgi:hypothetical protein
LEPAKIELARGREMAIAMKVCTRFEV